MKIVNTAIIVIVVICLAGAQRSSLFNQPRGRKGRVSAKNMENYIPKPRINPFEMEIDRYEPEQSTESQPEIQQYHQSTFKGAKASASTNNGIGFGITGDSLGSTSRTAHDNDQTNNQKTQQAQEMTLKSDELDKAIKQKKPQQLQRGVSKGQKQPSQSILSHIVSFFMDVIGRKIQHSLGKQTHSKDQLASTNTTGEQVSGGTDLSDKNINKQQRVPQKIQATQILTPEQIKIKHKKQKRKDFIVGTLIFGAMAMIAIKIYKNKEEESSDFHRSGVSIPIEEIGYD